MCSHPLDTFPLLDLSSLATRSEFLPCPLCSFLRRRLLQGNGCWPVIHSFSPSGDFVPFGATPRSQVILASHPQVPFPMMNLGHILHLRCRSTCVDNPLKYAPPHRNRSNIGFALTITFAFASIGSYVCHHTHQMCCPWILSCLPFLSSVMFFATRPFICSFSEIPRSSYVWSFLACSVASCVSFPCDRAHKHRRTTCGCSCLDHSVSFSHRVYRHSPKPLVLVRRRP